MKALRAGLIGCGFIGREHTVAARVDGRISVVSCVDVDIERARAFADWSGASAFGDTPDKVLDDPSVDVVIVATRHDSHVALGAAAAQRGHHLLMEKPVALTSAAVRELKAAVDMAGINCAVNYKFRLSPAVLAARSHVPRPKLLSAQLAMPPESPGSAGAWIYDPIQGGGIVHATGTHLLDLLPWLADSEVTQVSASTAPWPDQPTERSLVAWLMFASGAMATLSMADAGENPVPSKWMAQLYDGGSTAVVHEHLATCVTTGLGSGLTAAGAPASMVSSLVDSILTGSTVHAGLEDAIRATTLAEALIDSAGTRRVVSL